MSLEREEKEEEPFESESEGGDSLTSELLNII